MITDNWARQLYMWHKEGQFDARLTSTSAFTGFFFTLQLSFALRSPLSRGLASRGNTLAEDK